MLKRDILKVPAKYPRSVKVIHGPPVRYASMRQWRQWRADQLDWLQGGIFEGSCYMNREAVPNLNLRLAKGSQQEADPEGDGGNPDRGGGNQGNGGNDG